MPNTDITGFARQGNLADDNAYGIIRRFILFSVFKLFDQRFPQNCAFGNGGAGSARPGGDPVSCSHIRFLFTS